jgi:hypothetical protein
LNTARNKNISGLFFVRLNVSALLSALCRVN